MALDKIFRGTVPKDNTGDSLWEAAPKINAAMDAIMALEDEIGLYIYVTYENPVATPTPTGTGTPTPTPTGTAEPTVITNIEPSTVTYNPETNQFRLPATLTTFTFTDGTTDMEATFSVDTWSFDEVVSNPFETEYSVVTDVWDDLTPNVLLGTSDNWDETSGIVEVRYQSNNVDRFIRSGDGAGGRALRVVGNVSVNQFAEGRIHSFGTSTGRTQSVFVRGNSSTNGYEIRVSNTDGSISIRKGLGGTVLDIKVSEQESTVATVGDTYRIGVVDDGSNVRIKAWVNTTLIADGLDESDVFTSGRPGINFTGYQHAEMNQFKFGSYDTNYQT